MMPETGRVANLFILGSFVAACTAQVERLPEPGETLAATAFALEAGGKGLNLAVAARRLGAHVDGLIAIGDDDLSALAEPALRRADLPVSMLRRRRAPTGAGVGFIAQSGETCLAVHSGANFALTGEDVAASAELVAEADAVLAQFEIPDAPIVEAFAIARAAGRLTFLNPSPFRPPSAAMLADTSILIVNVVEAAGLARMVGAPPPGDRAESAEPLAEALFERGVRALVVTIGSRGARAFRRGEEPLTQSAFPVAAIDTLGAGDAFAAGLAVALCEGRAWEDALTRAVAGGALATTRFGVFDALPGRDQVERLLERRATA
ncbi:ribokinase [Hansschlegelia sp. KR7-227]|uniref:ribokinase n=1 Tax=Hansschlegelia sp. KR7-227 TaxID=3400914 RepID=UPI003C116EBF